jgi:L-alanine-DL-glutamate epimerase-like enolase superfamily enzyme
MDRIIEISLHKISIPLIEPFITSLGRDDDALNVVVRIRTSSGRIGFGECSPYMPINGESQETAYIVGQYLSKVLLGMEATAIEAINEQMDSVIYANDSIKSAFDMACYDIAAQAAGKPLYEFLGGGKNKIITTDYTVSLGDPDKMAADAVKILGQGFPAIKVKLGKHGPTDVIRMQRIRTTVGPEIPIRIDANQGWSVEEAIETLQALGPLNIEHCEEPIARWNYLQLPRIRAASPIPIMADECLGDEHDAARLIAIDACQYMNIKLGKSGGIFHALEIVRLAKQAGIKLQVGAMIESRLAMTAFAHFALSSDQIVHYDFDTAMMLREDPVEGGIIYKNGGVIDVPDTPGLGARISNHWLEKSESCRFIA